MGRVEGLLAGIEMFKAYPVTGIGIGNFIPYRMGHLDRVSLEAHNIVGQVLGETGLLGAATFCAVVSIMLLNCYRIRRLSRQSPSKTADILSGFAFACQNAIFLLMIEGMFFHNLLRFNWLWLAAFSGLALRLIRSQTAESHQRSLAAAAWQYRLLNRQNQSIGRVGQ